MKIKLDFRSSQPIYIQIVDQVRQMVVNGELRPGDQLPTVRELATKLRVNFNTVARAYRLLDEAGLISTQQGRGTYIWDSLNPEATRRMRQESLAGLTRRYLLEAAKLDFSPEEVTAIFNDFIAEWKAGENPKEIFSEK